MAAATLSMLVPGLGHLLVGAYRRAIVLLALTLAIVVAAGAVVLAHPALGLRLLVVLLALHLALFGLRAFAVVDAGRSAAPAFVAALVVLTVVPHAAAGYFAVRGYTVLDRVFADAEPTSRARCRTRPLLPSLRHGPGALSQGRGAASPDREQGDERLRQASRRS